MKSAYELAMERLNRSEPSVKLTAAQKKQIAELESRCRAKLAEAELGHADRVKAAEAAGELEKAAEMRRDYTGERRKIEASFEEKKEAVRRGK